LLPSCEESSPPPGERVHTVSFCVVQGDDVTNPAPQERQVRHSVCPVMFWNLPDGHAEQGVLGSESRSAVPMRQVKSAHSPSASGGV
jgi:hypothetical protein